MAEYRIPSDPNQSLRPLFRRQHRYPKQSPQVLTVGKSFFNSFQFLEKRELSRRDSSVVSKSLFSHSKTLRFFILKPVLKSSTSLPAQKMFPYEGNLYEP